MLRSRTDLGGSVGSNNSHSTVVNRFNGPYLPTLRKQKVTHLKFVNNPPYRDLELTP